MEKRLPPSNPPWGIAEALIVLVLINFLAFMFRTYGQGFLLGIVDLLPGGQTQLNQLLVSSFIQTFLFLFFIFLVVVIMYKRGWRTLGLVRTRLGHWVKIGLINGVVLFISVVAIGALINWLLPVEVKPQPITEVIKTASTRWEMLIPFIVASIFAPISEELYFRGFLYPALRRKFGIAWGIIISSLIFGSLHFDLIRMIPLVFGGIWLNWLYEKSGSLYAPIMAHGVWNGIMTILILYVPATL